MIYNCYKVEVDNKFKILGIITLKLLEATKATT